MSKVKELTEALRKFTEANVDIQALLKSEGHNAKLEEGSEFWGDDLEDVNSSEALIKKYLKKSSSQSKALSSEDTDKVDDYVKSVGFTQKNDLLKHPSLKPVSDDFLGFLRVYFVETDGVLVIDDEGIISIVG